MPVSSASTAQNAALINQLLVVSSLVPRFLLCVASAIVCIRLCVWLRAKRLLPPLLSRKLMHLITGPCYCTLWLLFPTADDKASSGSGALGPALLSRYVISLIPLCSAVYFFMVGMGWWQDEGLVSAVSRSGQRSELCRGPFLYGVLHCAACCWYWTDCAVGVQLLCILCVGDGLADIAGRWATQRGVNRPLPWNSAKTAVGSASMLLGSLLSCAAILSLYVACGCLRDTSTTQLAWSTALLALVTTAVESLPVADVDNLTVFAAGALTSRVLHLCRSI